MTRRATRAIKVAGTIAVGIAVLGAAVALSRWSHVVADPVGVGAAIVGLSLVVFVSYATFILAGYRVRSDGTASIPRAVAWGVVALAAVLFVLGLFGLAVLVQRTP